MKLYELATKYYGDMTVRIVDEDNVSIATISRFSIHAFDCFKSLNDATVINIEYKENTLKVKAEISKENWR